MVKTYTYTMPEIKKQISFSLTENAIRKDAYIHKLFGQKYEKFLSYNKWLDYLKSNNSDLSVIFSDNLTEEHLSDICLFMETEFKRHYLDIFGCTAVNIETDDSPLNGFVGLLELPSAAVNALYRNKIYTLKDFVSTSKKDFMAMDYLGMETYLKLIDILSEKGIPERPEGHEYKISNSRMANLYNSLVNHISELTPDAKDFVKTMQAIGYTKEELRVEYSECGYEDDFEKIWTLTEE